MGASPAAAATSGPCDVYGAAGQRCVAAYSTTRALFANYGGSLYQVRLVLSTCTGGANQRWNLP